MKQHIVAGGHDCPCLLQLLKLKWLLCSNVPLFEALSFSQCFVLDGELALGPPQKCKGVHSSSNRQQPKTSLPHCFVKSNLNYGREVCICTAHLTRLLLVRQKRVRRKLIELKISIFQKMLLPFVVIFGAKIIWKKHEHWVISRKLKEAEW